MGGVLRPSEQLGIFSLSFSLGNKMFWEIFWHTLLKFKVSPYALIDYFNILLAIYWSSFTIYGQSFPFSNFSECQKIGTCTSGSELD